MAIAIMSLTCTVVSAAAVAPMVDLPPVRTGTYEEDLKDEQTGQFLIHYAVCAPAQLPEERSLGLIMAFHGSTHLALPTAEGWLRVLQRNNLADRYVIVAPKGQGDSLKDVDDAAVIKLMDWALATYPIDQRQVYAKGFSAGAWYAGNFGGEFQERFAGISMYAGGTGGRFPPKKDRDQAPPFYLVAGVEDGHKTSVYRARESLASLGYRFVFREVDGLGHDVGTDQVVDDNIRWMEQLRSNLQPLTPDQEAVLRKAAKASEGALMWMDPVQAASLVAIGGMHTAAVAAKVANSKEEAVRLALATHSSEGWFGPEQLALLTRYLKDKSGPVRQAAIQAIANPASWNWVEAKQVLVAVASAKNVALEDRLLAITCLGKAASLIVLSDRWDDLVIMPGLVNLLNDPVSEIRAGAAAILLPTKRDGDFGYDPSEESAATRAKAVALWRAWVEERCSAWKHSPAK